jgi:hypothetical protein
LGETPYIKPAIDSEALNIVIAHSRSRYLCRRCGLCFAPINSDMIWLK